MKHLSLLFFVLAFTQVFAQINTITLPFDVKEGIQSGQIVVSSSSLDIGTISNAFDGDLSTIARSSALNPMVVTLQNPNFFNITSTSFANNTEATKWTVETALSLVDLDNQSGSYQKLVSAVLHSGSAPSIIAVNASAKVIRLTLMKQCCDNFVHLSEWGITATQTIHASGICMRPNEVRLIPAATFQPAWYVSDSGGNEFLLSSGIGFSTSNPSVVNVNSAGVFASSGNLGESVITATWNGMNYQTKVKVVQDFVATPAEKKVVKVAMIIIDPPIPAANGQRFSETFWSFLGGPMALAQQTRDSIFSVSGGTIDYQFTEIHQENDLSLNRFGGSQLTADSLYKLFLEPNQATLHQVAEQLGQSQFEYNALLSKYNLCEKSNNHQIDEVWVWAMPFIGMYESNMAGTDAFWINGPVISGNSCTDLIPIMGFNYERFAGCALHNFTHRIELTMAKVYNTTYRYVPTDPPYAPGMKDAWRTFMLYDALEPGNAHIGNGHFPPNGIENYGYANLSYVPTYALNWKRYPYLFAQTEQINCTAWGCEGDCGINYCSWWLRHLPHFKCKDKTGRLNNWWTYIIDYNEGKTMEAQLSDCDCKMFEDNVSFCASKGIFPWEDWIAKVQLGNQDNASGKSQYSDFTGITLQINNNSAITLTSKFSYYTFNEYWRVWIDLNSDGDFDDNGEKVFEQILSAPPNGNDVTKSITGTLSLPQAVSGSKRMRISMKRGSYASPCEVFPYGEVEDYTVNIAAGLPDIASPNWELIPANNCYTNPGQAMGFYGATLVNFGNAPTGPFTATTVLSKDSIVSANDVIWQSFTFPGLDANGTGNYATSLTINAPVPSSLPVGMYYAITTLDHNNQVLEGNENNNVHIDWVRIGSPDFRIYSFESIPTVVQAGSWISVSLLVENLIPFPVFELSPIVNGVYAPGGAMEVEWYFSTDNQFQMGIDPLLNSTLLAYSDFNNQGLAATSMNGNIPQTGTPPGNYFLFIRLNVCDKVAANNVSAAIPIQIGAVQPTSYCASKSNFPWEDWISQVKIADLDKASGKSQYSNFTASSANVISGASYPIALKTAYSYTTFNEYYKIWIDYNKNGVFEEPTETYFSGILSKPVIGTPSATLNATGVIQSGIAQAVTTRMRVSMKRGSYPTPCETFGFGEVEDYTINISPGSVPPIGVDLSLAISLSVPNPPNYSNFSTTVTITNTGATTATGVKVKISTPTGIKLQGGNEFTPATSAFTPYSTQEWTVGSLLTGQSKSITVNYFRKSTAATSFYTQVVAQNEPDADSQPNNGTCCNPQQDDEAVVSYAALSVGSSNLVGAQNQVIDPDDFEVFPNPAGEYVNIQIKSWISTPIQVDILNHFGQKVQTQKYDAAQTGQLINVSLSEVQNGHYFLRLSTENQRDVVKSLVVARLY